MRPRSCVVVTPPTVEPVALSEVRDHLRLTADQTEHDAYLLGLLATARRLVERRLGVTLAPVQYRAKWPAGAVVLELANPPLLTGEDYPLAVTVGGDAVAEEDYELDGDRRPAELELGSPATGEVVVTYWAGGQLAPQIRSAILLLVGHLFAHREAVTTEAAPVEVPMAVETLLASESVTGVW